MRPLPETYVSKVSPGSCSFMQSGYFSITYDSQTLIVRLTATAQPAAPRTSGCAQVARSATVPRCKVAAWWRKKGEQIPKAIAH